MSRCAALLLCALLTLVPAGLRPRVGESPRGQAAAAAVRPLPFFYDLYTFRGRGAATTVVAAFAVPVGQLEREAVSGRSRYRFDVSLVLADTARRTVTRTDDSVFVDLPRPPYADHLLYTQIEVQTRPSHTTQQRVIMTDAATPGVGQLYCASFTIPDYSGSELMLSDVALGRPLASSGWRRGDVTLALLPTSQFPSSAFDVYYEIYNLPPGHRYTTEIAVEPVTDGGRQVQRPVRVRFGGAAAPRRDGAIPELRHVAAALARGRYRISVTITDAESGKSARRAREFQVRGWERGATLVAASPRRVPTE